MVDNQILKARMAEAGLTQAELAEAVNAELQTTGCEGTVSDRTVRNWLTGKTGWPHRRQRVALEVVFRCPIAELGFVPRGKASETMPRRRFVGAATGATVAAYVGSTHAARPRVGTSDVQRLLSKFAVLVASDHRYGGRLTIETQASALAGEALALQARGTASQRVRGALYGCAASFTSSAMWAAIDGRRFDAAQRHFNRASSLAAMSGDQAIQFRIWSHAGSLYRHLARPADALAANDVARRLPITRRDPLFASLGHARHAAIHGQVGNARGVHLTLNDAREAFQQADPRDPRPVWMTAVCDQAELEELGLSAHLRLGNYEEAEAHAHRSLALLRPYMQRDRAIVTARLARAQLGQGALEHAVATAMTIPSASADEHPRVADLLHDFSRALRLAASLSTPAQTWDEYTYDSRRR